MGSIFTGTSYFSERRVYHVWVKLASVPSFFLLTPLNFLIIFWLQITMRLCDMFFHQTFLFADIFLTTPSPKTIFLLREPTGRVMRHICLLVNRMTRSRSVSPYKINRTSPLDNKHIRIRVIKRKWNMHFLQQKKNKNKNKNYPRSEGEKVVYDRVVLSGGWLCPCWQ